MYTTCTGRNGIWWCYKFGKAVHIPFLVPRFNFNFIQELMRDGDPEGLLHGLKIAATVLDRSVLGRLKIQNLVINFFVDDILPSFGQVPWLMDIIWHLPFGSSMHLIRHRAAAMMRQRQSLKQKVDMSDLSSYLVRLFH